MAKYIYPAVIVEEDDCFQVSFPDFDGINTFGKDLQEAYDMAEDALSLMLYDIEDTDGVIPAASDINAIRKKHKTDIVTLVSCDTIVYREQRYNRLVKKTVTIEYWLNRMGEKANLNFSQLLRNAIKQELNIL